MNESKAIAPEEIEITESKPNISQIKNAVLVTRMTHW